MFPGDVGHGDPYLAERCAGTAWPPLSGTRASTGHGQARPPVGERRDRGCERSRAARAIAATDATDGRENGRYDRLGMYKRPVKVVGSDAAGRLIGRVSRRCGRVMERRFKEVEK